MSIPTPTAATQRLRRPGAGWTPAQTTQTGQATQTGAVRRAYIGIGSNLHSPEQQLQRAVQALAQTPHSRLLRVSRWYRNPALLTGGPQALPGPQALTAPQPEYLNAVAALDSALSAPALLEALLCIERRQGRVRDGRRWAARTLDLDLLLYGELRIDVPGLQLPHPRMLQRDFVLYPLFDLDPALTLPGGLRLSQALKNLPKRGSCRPLRDHAAGDDARS